MTSMLILRMSHGQMTIERQYALLYLLAIAMLSIFVIVYEIIMIERCMTMTLTFRMMMKLWISYIAPHCKNYTSKALYKNYAKDMFLTVF